MDNKPASSLVVPLGKALRNVINRWPATPKRARTVLPSLSRDRRIKCLY